MKKRTWAVILCVVLAINTAYGADITVAKSGGDYSVIQDALDNANAGDVITVRAGTYEERLYIERSGSATLGHIVLRAYPGEEICISGNNEHKASDPHMIYMESQSYVKIIGFNICSNRANASDGGSGIFIEGAGNHIQILSNRIYEIRGTHGMGITVYGTEATAISDLIISGNEIFDCEPATSEALTLNGNVRDFEVTANYVHDVNNIGIDFIGGEVSIHPTLGARNGVCARNIVKRARSSYGGGYAGGIYVDGGRNIIIGRNSVSECDMGMEVGAENSGWNTTGIVVRSNLIYDNDKVGIVFGGYDGGLGRVKHCRFFNNTICRNNALGLSGGDFHGEFIIQYAEDNEIENNIVLVSGNGDRRAISEASSAGNVNNDFDYNLYYCGTLPASAQFQWKGSAYSGFTSYTNAATTGDPHSLFDNPDFIDGSASDYHLLLSSPAIDNGNPLYNPGAGVKDFEGNDRVIGGRVDIGAYESVPEPWGAALWAALVCSPAFRRLGSGL